MTRPIVMPYEWMSKPTPHEEWISGEGKLIWLALFFMEVGAGLCFFSIIFDNLLGMLSGWFIALALGGGSFLVHMGKPLKAYRAIMRPQTSWISRGVIFISLFGVFGAIYIILSYRGVDLNLLPLQIITGVFCFLVALYGGVVLSYVRALPLWNTGLLPMIYITAGFWGGAEVLLGISLLMGSSVESIELWIRVLLPFFALLVPLYLMSVRYSSETGSLSVRRILAGDLCPHFYVGVVCLGLVIPLIVLAYSIWAGVGAAPHAIILFAIICGLLGDLTMRYCIMKASLYTPLI
ncbi:MAG: DmsC/YnfH family molybdoenzyme membrane anchor subunit [Thermodesulfobacteriota bacterium]|nr:DmsC/YnfH family molybdoenzyme membrane anchor subunit [Thermodesulfobacteriota bacterium]